MESHKVLVEIVVRGESKGEAKDTVVEFLEAHEDDIIESFKVKGVQAVEDDDEDEDEAELSDDIDDEVDE